MGCEINLLDLYPKSKRPIDERSNIVTEKHREISRQFGKEYFDGDRMYGYGGYGYNERFWKPTVVRFQEYYKLPKNPCILDVGCAKGFMMYDFQNLLPEANMNGIDISKYALDHAIEEMKPSIQIGNAIDLPFPDKSFDLVISINTLHNLPLEECKQGLLEIQRVTRNYAFIMVDAWRNDLEKERFKKWNLTALTYMHVQDWINLFNEVGYNGDYYWFLA